jgi:eukaryotic translation initiation factor 2C
VAQSPSRNISGAVRRLPFFYLATYFDNRFTEYKINLRYPNLPLVDVGGQKSILLPPEVCSIIPGQPFRGRLLDEQTSEMIKVAAKTPNVNAHAITVSGLRELGFIHGPNVSPLLDIFGIAIGNEMAVVPARILIPPRIRYGKGEQSVDDRASWNLRNVVFAEGSKLGPWTVLVIKDGNRREEFGDAQDPELRNVIQGFASMCRTCGISVPQAPPLIAMAELPRKDPQDPIRSQAINAIRSALMATKQKPTFLLVILSNGDKHIYSGLKHLCDVYLDVPNVCVQAGKIRKDRGQLQYFANVALKVNMKLGGINHSVDDPSLSKLRLPATMVVGMDVTHPGPSTVKGTPSIAAVVASADLRFSQYPASMRIQETKKEVCWHFLLLRECGCSPVTPVSDDHGLEGYGGRAFTSLPNQESRSPSEDSRLPRWCLGSSSTFLSYLHTV